MTNTTENQIGPRIIVALDFPEEQAAMAMVQQLDPSMCRLKVGKELFVRSGPQLVEKIQKLGFDVFLDLKFYDIPNTVAGACRAAADLGVWMVNVHASGGHKMMEAAREAVTNSSHQPYLIAVTILTSMTSHDLSELGFDLTPMEEVQRLAAIAGECGMDGVVCSPMEAKILTQQMGKEFKLVTPGVRPEGSDRGDQNRVMTPIQALQAGSDFLVIGRPVTAVEDPIKSLENIISSIRNV